MQSNYKTEEQRKRIDELWLQQIPRKEIAKIVNQEYGTAFTDKAIQGHAAYYELPVRKNPEAWSVERDNRLKALWAEGNSGLICMRILNDEFGVSLTRNAIMGRVYRLGLPSHERKVCAPRGPKPRAARPPKLPRPPKLKPIPIPTPTIEDAQIPFGQRKQLLDLGENDCRWPVGDPLQPGFFFCGGKTAEGCSYCPAHAHRSVNHEYRWKRAA